MTRRVDAAHRRRILVARHHLAGDLDGAEAATRALLCLHATDPASVHLSVLARAHRTTIAETRAAMYERRTLVRWMAMRRTLFVFDRDDVAAVQAAVSTPLAGRLRRQLVARLVRNGTDPAIDGDAAAWLVVAETQALDALERAGSATGAQLARAAPLLRTVILPRAASEARQAVTTVLLTILSAEGRIVRGDATGAWTSRQHRLEPVARWWPDGLPQIESVDAERALARRWLERFGPASPADLQWWTGWTKATTARALAALPLEAVDLDGEPGVVLEGGLDVPAAGPVAALLPALDPTPMGWQGRDWFLGVDRGLLFDRNGNIGPTVWWDGEIVGAWAVATDGEVRTGLAADRGADARDAVAAAAALLQQRLDGAVPTPVFPTPLARSLLA